MENKTLGDLVFEALEEYSPPKGKFGKFKSSLDKFIAKHYKKIIFGSTLLFAGLGYVYGTYLGGVIEAVKGIPEYALRFQDSSFLNEHISEVTKSFGILAGGFLGSLSSILTLPSYVGKRVYSKVKYKKKKVKKIGRIFRYPKTTGAISVAVLNFKDILGTPERINKIIEVSKRIGMDINAHKECALLINKEINYESGFIIMAVGLSTVFYILRDFENMGKKGFQNIRDVFRVWNAKILSLGSTEKKIKRLEKLVEKKGTEHAKYSLGKELYKKDIYQGLHYFKKLIDEIKEGGIEFAKFKNCSIGVEISRLFNKKDNWLAFFEIVEKIRKENSEATKKIINKFQNSFLEENMSAYFLVTYYGEEYLDKPQDEAWESLSKTMFEQAGKTPDIVEHEGSECKVRFYKGKGVEAAHLAQKLYPFNFFPRFLKQRFEYINLKKEDIKTEKPLACTPIDEYYVALVTLEGEKSLRDFLKDKDKIHKEVAFKKVIYEDIKAQKALYENLRQEKGNFFMDVVYKNKLYSEEVPIMDLKDHLLRRAIIGDQIKKNRFGKNDYFDEFFDLIISLYEQNYAPIEEVVNHGDFFTTNLTDKYVRLDQRHNIGDVLFDLSHISLDPVFLDIEKREKVETVFNALKNVLGFDDEARFKKSFDYFYCIHNALGLAASHNAHNDVENAAMILNEHLNYFKGSRNEKKVLNYLKNSNAARLLKII